MGPQRGSITLSSSNLTPSIVLHKSVKESLPPSWPSKGFTDAAGQIWGHHSLHLALPWPSEKPYELLHSYSVVQELRVGTVFFEVFWAPNANCYYHSMWHWC